MRFRVFAFKSLFICAMAMDGWGGPVPLPPSIPNVPAASTPNQPTPPTTDPCREVPPMLVMLPPPLAEARARCVSHMHLPKKREAEAILKEKMHGEVRVEKIEAVEGFDDLYRIEGRMGAYGLRLFCDGALRHCIEGERKW